MINIPLGVSYYVLRVNKGYYPILHTLFKTLLKASAAPAATTPLNHEGERYQIK